MSKKEAAKLNLKEIVSQRLSYSARIALYSYTVADRGRIREALYNEFLNGNRRNGKTIRAIDIYHAACNLGAEVSETEEENHGFFENQ
jgi:hypothetical protein